MKKVDLIRLINDDDLGLLKLQSKSSPVMSEEARLVTAFEEIRAFAKRNGRGPVANSSDIREFQLHSRLKGIKSNPRHKAALASIDDLDLLASPDELESKIETMKDLFADDDYGLLNDAEDIFTLKHVPKDKQSAEYIARRKKCDDFDDFKGLFEACHLDLRTQKRRLLPFAKERQISQGLFFVLKGILIYIAELVEDPKNLRSPRMRIIFENGTEADLLRHSLGAQLYKDGRRVSEHDEKLLAGFSNVSADDTETGFLYVLKSMSTDQNVSRLRDLYKVGFSRNTVEERIQNSERDPTFLMAPVSIVVTYRCYNLNPRKLENLLHTFFGNACLNIEVTDLNGTACSPREWFIAPLDVIESALELVLNGEIVNFKYDETRKQIIAR